MDFDAHLVKLDHHADKRVGNSVMYAGRVIKAFLQLPDDEPDVEEYSAQDPLNNRNRLKVNKCIVSLPATSDIIEHPRLEGPYRPENWKSVEGHRYWLIDLQKA